MDLKFISNQNYEQLQGEELTQRILCFGIEDNETGEMAQWLKALRALSKDSGLIPSIYNMAAHNMKLKFQGF